jgi:hypothetical protein
MIRCYDSIQYSVLYGEMDWTELIPMAGPNDTILYDYTILLYCAEAFIQSFFESQNLPNTGFPSLSYCTALLYYSNKSSSAV